MNQSTRSIIAASALAAGLLIGTLAVAACSSSSATGVGTDGGTFAHDSGGATSDASKEDAGPGSMKPCTFPGDCAATQEVCAFPVADGCNAMGRCLTPNPNNGAFSCASETVCGCDGKTTSLNQECPYPSGYTSTPHASMGACPSDGGGD